MAVTRVAAGIRMDAVVEYKVAFWVRKAHRDCPQMRLGIAPD